MSNIKYLDLLPEVPHLSCLVSDPLAEAAIKNAVIEFCRDSWVWRHFADVQHVVASNAFHDFEPPAGNEVAQVLACLLDGVPFTPLYTVALYEQLPTRQTMPGTVKFFTNGAPPPCSWPPCQTVAKQQGRRRSLRLCNRWRRLMRHSTN